MLIIPLVLFSESKIKNLKVNALLPAPYVYFRYAHSTEIDFIRLKFKNRLNHNTLLELIWTFIPICLLIYLAYPTFWALIALDESSYWDYSYVSIHVVGKQWNWEYLIQDPSNNLSYSFDSFIIEDKDLKIGDLRLLEVDKPLVIPVYVPLRFFVTSEDVIHSWAVPSFGIKIDAVPGRLNSVTTQVNYEGVYFGQCSELCGVNHGYMPIKVIAVSMLDFEHYLELFDSKFVEVVKEFQEE